MQRFGDARGQLTGCSPCKGRVHEERDPTGYKQHVARTISTDTFRHLLSETGQPGMCPDRRDVGSLSIIQSIEICQLVRTILFLLQLLRTDFLALRANI